MDTNPNAVRVAVIIRPLVTPEAEELSHCITVTPGQPQVQIGSHSFKFDHVYGDTTGSTSSRIFDDCVAPLVDAFFHGYNATVLAYGQTGSGKTYTMGSNYSGESTNGIIPKAMQTIFRHVEATKGSTEYLIRVSFIEIFKEEVFDLLESSSVVYSKGDGNGKGTGPSRAPIQIRETANGGILLAGVTEAEVTSQEEMALFLLRGSACRATGSTKMNSQSSRSHAIFTISLEQKRIAGVTSVGGHDDVGDEILSAKLHLVDLAGSERAKKTGADGMQLREGININKGLLALGNVISALGDEKKRREGGHVPYRDSKLTRLLQDSLGGNSKTVMIACVSPADTNAAETLNTLKYANRARNIQNKAIVNRDLVTAKMQMMKNQIEQLQTELLNVKGDSSTPFEERQKQKIAVLEGSHADLLKQLQEHQVYVEYLTKQASDAHVLKQKIAELERSEYLTKQATDAQILKQKIADLERSNTDLQKQQQEHQVNVEYLTKQATDAQILKQKIAELERSNTDLQKQQQEHQVNVEYLTKQASDAQILQQKIAELERSNTDLQKQQQEHQVNVEYLTKQATDAQILQQRIAELERSNTDLQKQQQEHQVNVEYLTKQATDAQILQQKIAELERSNTDLQKQQQEHQVNVEYLTKQATDAQILQQKIAELERSNTDLQKQQQEHQVNVEYLTKQATDAQILLQKIAELERSNTDLQKQQQEHQVNVEYLTKQATDAQILQQKIAELERSNTDLQKQQEHQVNVEYLTKQAIDAQILQQKIAELERSNTDLQKQQQEHQVNVEYLTKQATDAQILQQKIAELERSNTDLQKQQEHQVNVEYLTKQAIDAQILQQKIAELERSNTDLQKQQQEHQVNVEYLTKQATDAQILQQKIAELERSNTDLQKQQEHQVNVEYLTKQAIDAQILQQKIAELERSNTDLQKQQQEHQVNVEYLTKQATDAQILQQKIAELERSNTDLQKQQEHQVNVEYLTKQAIDAQILQQKIAELERSNTDLQKQQQEHQVNVEYLTKQATDAQILQQKIAELERSNTDLQKQQEHQVNLEYLTKQAIDAQILQQKIAELERSNTDLQKQQQEHQVNVEYLTKQATDAQILQQKIAELERSNTDLQKQLQEHQFNVDAQILKQKIVELERSNTDLQKHQVNVEYLTKQDAQILKQKIAELERSEYLTKQATDAQILKQKIAVLERSNTDLQNKLHQHQVNVEYVTKQASDAQTLKQKMAVLERSYTDLQNQLYEHQVNAQYMKRHTAVLGSSNADLEKRVQEYQANVEYLTKQASDAQSEKERLLLKIQSARDGKPWDEIDCDLNKDVNVLKSYKSRNQELEGDVLPSERLNTSKRSDIDYLDLDDNTLHPKSCLFPESDSKTAEVVDNFEDEEKELEHCSLQEKPDNELKELDKRLEQTEAEMRRIAGGDTSVPTHDCEKKVQELEQAKRNMQKLMSKSFKRKSTNRDSTVMEDGEGHADDLRPKGLRNSIAFYEGSGNMEELLDDMDTSESEHSDLDATKRNSKIAIENNTESETHNTSLSEENLNRIQKAHSGTCCTCSKNSSCKTSKCQCRVINGLCSVSCRCHPKKCSNREAVSVEDSDLKPTVTVGNVILLDDEDIEKNSSELASQGAMVLQAALSDKPAEIDGMERKRLSNIGNKVALREATSEMTDDEKKLLRYLGFGSIQKAHSGTCCTCSKMSSCKTSKCECRVINGLCSVSCGCHPKKCSNREPVSVSVEDSGLKPTATVWNVNLLGGEDTDNHAETKNTKRKPLSDIHNKIVKSNAPKPPAARKQCRKSTIKLVPVASDQPSSSQTQEQPEAPKKQETSTTEPSYIPLRLMIGFFSGVW